MASEGRNTDRWLAVGLCAVVLAVFARAIAFPFVHWDDGLHVGDNPVTLHPFAEGWRGLLLTPRLGYPVPITQLSFCLDRLLFGLNAHAYHAENVALHAANALLVARLGRRLGLPARAAHAAALLFAVHPLVVEPVCWVTGRKDLLSAALLLAALVVASAPRAHRIGRALGAAVGLALLAMLAKPSTVIAPLLFVLVLRRARPELGWRAVAIPAGALAIAAGVVTWLGLIGEEGVAAVRDRQVGDAVREIGGALGVQLGHVVWPAALLPRYFRVPGEPSVLAIVLAFVAALGLAVAARLAAPRSTGRRAGSTPALSPCVSIARTGLVFAAIAYLPVSGLVGLNRWFADSYMYLPLVGLAYAAAGLACARWPARLANVGAGLFGVAVIALAIRSSSQSLVWRSSSTLWPAVVARFPTVPRAWALQASGDLADGKTAEATQIYVRLHEQFPDYDGAVVNQVYAYETLGEPDAARDLWRRCLTLGKAPCVDVFWDRRLYATPAPPDDRELEAIAFRAGQDEMTKHLRDAATWRRVALLLHRVGLDDEASQAEARARALGGAPSP
jgi:hypothetical protein